MSKEESQGGKDDGSTVNEPLSWDALYEGMVYKPISKDSGEEVMMYDSNGHGCMYFEKESWNPFIMEKVGEAEKGYIYSGP